MPDHHPPLPGAAVVPGPPHHQLHQLLLVGRGAPDTQVRTDSVRGNTPKLEKLRIGIMCQVGSITGYQISDIRIIKYNEVSSLVRAKGTISFLSN